MSFVADEKKRGKNGLSEDEGFDDGGDDDRDSGDSSWRSSLVHGEDTNQDGVLMVDFCYIGSETGASVAGGPQPSRALLAASAAMQREQQQQQQSRDRSGGTTGRATDRRFYRKANWSGGHALLRRARDLDECVHRIVGQPKLLDDHFRASKAGKQGLIVAILRRALVPSVATIAARYRTGTNPSVSGRSNSISSHLGSKRPRVAKQEPPFATVVGIAVCGC